MPRVRLAWPKVKPDPNLREWRVFGNPDQEIDAKGLLLATVPATESCAIVEVAEGWWRFRVCGVTRPEQETAWETTITVLEGHFGGTRPDDKPDALVNVGAGAVGEGFLRAVIDPTPRDAKTPRVQLIGGPPSGVITEPTHGHLLAEYVQPSSDVQGMDAASAPSPAFQLEGQGRSDVRTLFVRPISAEGTPGDAVTRSIVAPDRAHTDRRVVASIDRTAGTYTGFPAPASTDGWEASATYGFRARALPPYGSSLWASGGWGAVGSGGLFDSLLAIAYYVDNAKIQTNEIDLGAEQLFQLDLYHEAHRRDEKWSTEPFGYFNTIPAVPHEHRQVRFTGESAAWAMREMIGNVPRQPLRRIAWDYVAGNSTPLATSESDWKRYVPGLWIKARYFRVRLRWIETIPWFRFATGSVHVAVLRPRAWLSGSGSPEGVVEGAFGQTYVQTNVTPNVVWTKTTATGNTGWLAQGGVQPGAVNETGYLNVTVSADQNDYAPAGIGAVTQLNVALSGGGHSITGIVLSDGQRLTIRNLHGNADDLTLKDQDAGSSAGNRFGLGGSDVVLTPGEAITVWKNPATSRVSLCNPRPGGGGGGLSSPLSADLDFGGNKGTNAADGSAADDLATVGQTEGYADAGDAATLADAKSVVSDVMRPPGLAANGSTTAFGNGNSYAVYLGRAKKTDPTLDVMLTVKTAYVSGGIGPFAKVAIAIGAFVANGAATLTSVGSVDVSGVFNATGVFKTTISTSGVAEGDDLWLVMGSKTALPINDFQVGGCQADEIQSGVVQLKTNQDPSALSGSAMTLAGASLVPPSATALQS